MFLFFDFTFHPTIELVLPNTYIAEERNGYCVFYKRANQEVLQSLPNWQLSVVERQALAIANELLPNVLYQKLLKKGDTFEKAYQNKQTKKHIEEYIEKKTAELLQLIADNELFITTNYTHKDELVKKQLQVQKTLVVPLLEFTKTDESIEYRLLLKDGAASIIPSQHSIELLNNLYGWIVIDHKVVRVEHFKGSYLTPFLNKETIHIPKRNFPEYFDKFLKKLLKHTEIDPKGFEIIKKNDIVATEIELIYDFFANHYKLQLNFDYSGYIFGSHQRKEVQSELKIYDDGGIVIYQYKRNKEEEAKKYDFLTAIGFSEEAGSFWVKDENPFGSYFLLVAHKDELEKAGFSFKKFVIEGDKEVGFGDSKLIFGDTQGDNDWFDLSIRVAQGDEEFAFKDLIENIKSRNPVYDLGNGKVFIIPQEWFSRFHSIAKYARVTQEKLQLPKSNYALLESVPEIKPQTLVENVVYTASPNLKATLRPYQIEGVTWLLQHYYNGVGACLADDMGLGKTLQTIALLVHIHDSLPEKLGEGGDLFSGITSQKEPLRALVILPSSLIFNWYDETKRFAPHLKCTQYVGNTAERKRKVRRLVNYDIIFSSYPIVERDSKELQQLDFRYIILDESQRIKNKNSKTFKAINGLQGVHRIALSGTPIENSLSDLWSQMQFINPNILKSYAAFHKNYEVAISKNKDTQALEELKTIISPFLLRRTKEQVLDDLPEMESQIAYCEMSEEQKKWYESEKSKVRNQLLEIDAPLTEFNALNMLTKLRQISNHPKLVDKESVIASGKYEEVVHCMEELLQASHKALIFSSFVSHLALYEQWCDAHKIKYAKLTGSTPTEERKNEVALFQQQADVPFFFISLKAGEVGLNLTAASYVLLLDPWWNPFSERQAIARAHRIGQRNKVNVVRFVSKDTVEEKIIRLQQAKTSLFEDVVGEDNFIREVIDNIEELL